GHEHLGGTLLADQPWQRIGQPETRMDAELDEVGAEARVRTGDAEVRKHGKTEAAADRRALDRSDHRLLVREQPDGLLVQRIAPARRRTVQHRGLAPSEVGAGAKRLALRAEQYHASFGGRVDVAQRIRKVADQRMVEEVVRWTLDLQRHDMVLQAGGDVAVAVLEHRLNPHARLRRYPDP